MELDVRMLKYAIWFAAVFPISLATVSNGNTMTEQLRYTEALVTSERGFDSYEALKSLTARPQSQPASGRSAVILTMDLGRIRYASRTAEKGGKSIAVVQRYYSEDRSASRDLLRGVAVTTIDRQHQVLVIDEKNKRYAIAPLARFLRATTSSYFFDLPSQPRLLYNEKTRYVGPSALGSLTVDHYVVTSSFSFVTHGTPHEMLRQHSDVFIKRQNVAEVLCKQMEADASAVDVFYRPLPPSNVQWDDNRSGPTIPCGIVVYQTTQAIMSYPSHATRYFSVVRSLDQNNVGVVPASPPAGFTKVPLDHIDI